MKLFKRIIAILFLLFFIALATVFVTVTFYKKELAKILVNNLKDSYGLVLKVEDVNVSFLSNWPNTSIQFKNVFIASSQIPDEPVLLANSLSLSFNIEKLLQRKFEVHSIALKDGEISLVKNKLGEKNYEFKKKDSITKSNSSINFDITKVVLKNVRFRFLNKQYNKKIEFTFLENVVKLHQYSDGLDAHLTGDILIKGLLFRKEKGPFLSNTMATLNLWSRVCYNRKEIFIHSPSYAQIDKHQYDLSAFISLKDKKQLALTIEGKNAEYHQVISLLNDGVKRGLSKIKISQPVHAKALIIVEIGKQQDPIIIVHVNSSKNNITIGHSGVPYSDVSFKASIISLDSSLTKGDGDHAKVILKPFTGNVYDFPFKGTVTIHGFTNPFIVVSANLFVDAKNIKFKVVKEFVLTGTASIDVAYSGPVNKLNEIEFLDKPMNLHAKVKFNNVCYKEKKKPYVYCVNGKATVLNSFLKFDDLSLKMDGGNLKLKGSVDNFTKYSLGLVNGFKAVLSAKTDHFDLTGYLKKSAQAMSSEEKDQSKIEKDAANAKIEKNATDLNESNFEFDVSLEAKKLVVRKVEAREANINLNYKDKLLDIRSLNAITCNGNIFLKGSVYDLRKINASVTTENINVNQLFDQFENFGQKAIESNNLQGKVSLDAKIKMDLDDKMEVIGNSISGQINFNIKDGHLLDYEPLQKISTFIFRNRDFKDISFTELHETLYIEGFKMDIKEMEIASNVLNLYMSGVYHFKENSNINILIPWSNLKKRGKNYIPVNSGKSAEDSKGLKLNYSGYPGKLKLGLGHSKENQ
ncbi:MAG: hypothetical protein H7141_04020 [Burkholderiales bacterium]|nr:hypothetical protein [Bacteroidia bacterium]